MHEYEFMDRTSLADTLFSNYLAYLFNFLKVQ